MPRVHRLFRFRQRSIESVVQRVLNKVTLLALVPCLPIVFAVDEVVWPRLHNPHPVLGVSFRLIHHFLPAAGSFARRCLGCNESPPKKKYQKKINKKRNM